MFALNVFALYRVRPEEYSLMRVFIRYDATFKFRVVQL